jgi:hypothetical protein
MAVLSNSDTLQLATLPINLNGILYYFGYKNYSAIFGSKLCAANINQLLYNAVPRDTSTSKNYSDGYELMSNLTLKPIYNANNEFYAVRK